jgi:hypothetical protein
LALLGSLRHATRTQVQQAIGARDVEREEGILHFDDDASSPADNKLGGSPAGQPDGIVNLQFDHHNLAVIIDARITIYQPTQGHSEVGL